MFKNIQFFKISGFAFDLSAAEAAFATHQYVECGASQEESTGWIPPRGEDHGVLIESIGGHWIAKMMVETKILPGSVVADEVKKRTLDIESKQGRKPGKKEKKEITEDVRNGLMAQAFTKKSATFVWLDKEAEMLVIESSTQNKSDAIVSQLVKSLDGIQITAMQTQQSPATAMAGWLVSREMPSEFTADRDCTLKSQDETKASIKYAKHALDIEEIQAHIKAGKVPTQLAMTWNSRVSFVLTDGCALKKLEFVNVVAGGKADSEFDGNVAIATAEISQLIPALITALGGTTLA